MRSAQDLLDELNAVDESTRIDAKRASDLGKSVMETVIAFANEPGLDGGYLLLGVDWAINAKGDTVYTPAGLSNPDKVQADLASQCASMLNVALRPQMQLEQIDGKTLLVVYVPEADARLKPIYKKATGLPSGAWRRIGSSDQRCVDEDLWALQDNARPMRGVDSTVLDDARMEDFDPAALAEYRRVRATVNAQAEELGYSDADLLEAVGAVRREGEALHPTLAGILLFGKPMALRRMLPMVRIDYIRVPGMEWIEDPHNRFQSIDIRKPLVLALPQAEASVVDELPKGFYLPEGSMHSVQEPIVPRKVIREAIANAVMHRTYTKHNPIQIIRYSNRIEVRNAGHSLKPMAQLGNPGSWPRNPLLGSVLRDLNLAENKGSGIRTMRRLAADAGLTLPEFQSDREADTFCVTLFLHNLLTEDDHAWLRSLTPDPLDEDETKVLIYARATGAVDNTACRDFSGLDTLTASRVLRRLRDKGLLDKQGGGNRTYYVLRGPAMPAPPDMAACNPGPAAGGDLPASMGGLPQSPHAWPDLPPELQLRIDNAGAKPRQAEVRALLLELCRLQAFTVAQLCQILNRSDAKELRRTYLRPMREAGLLRLKYPETEKHPHQAYIATQAENNRHE
ncbi:MAG: ATP-binding protein [Thauera sp.]|jgi:ATP-dependent DNA helicase RecG|nr:ATP-binding protein [Thauera sp.]